jgi:AsmA family protein
MNAQGEAGPPNAAPPHRLSARHAWIAAALLAALVGVVAFVPALRTVDLTPLRGVLVSLVRAQTGRALTLGSGPAVRLSLSPALIGRNVALANAPWGSQPIMLRAKRVEVAVRALPLLLGRVEVTRVVLASPDLLLETDGRGHVNWTLQPPGGVQPSPKPRNGSSLLSHLRLREVRVTDASLRYRNGATGNEVRVAVPVMTLAPTGESRGDLDLRVALDVNGTSVSLRGVVGGPAAITGAQPFPFHVTATTAGATATLQGSVARLLELEGVEGTTSLDVSDPRGLSALLGVRLPRVSPFRISAGVRDAGRGFAVQPLRAEVGGTTLSGTLTYTPGPPRPLIAGELSGPRVDLAELFGGTARPQGQQKAQPASATRVFSSAPLALDWFNAVDAKVEVHAGTLVLADGVTASGAAAQGAISKGTLTLDPFSMTLGGGRLTGRLRLAAGHAPGLGVDLSGERVALTPLLGALGVDLPCDGCATNLTTSLQGAGTSVHEWMASLDGTARVEVGKGRLDTGTPNLGGDVLAQVLGAINPFHKTERTMDLRCGVVNVAVERGVVRFGKGVGAETSKLDLVASGTANLGKEVLDFEVHSRATQGLGLGLGSFSGAVRVTGPLTNPSVGLNPLDVAESTVTTVGAAAATGGISILAKRIWDRLFERSPCAAARRRRPHAPAEPGGPQKK